MKHDVPDALWPSDNNYGIPSLLLSMQADAVDLPVVTWGTVSRTKRMNGTWGFYTEDYRYEALWSDPSLLLRTGCVNVIEPNFSVYNQTPPAVAVYQIYRKRWLARYWQSKGVRVFVDMNVNKNFAEDNLQGVPAGWSAFATRGYNERISDTYNELSLSRAIAGKKDILFIVYGGGKNVKQFCMDNGCIHIDEQENGHRQKTNTVQTGFMFKEV